MFVVYQEEQQMTLKRLIEEFNNKVSQAGAMLKIYVKSLLQILSFPL